LSYGTVLIVIICLNTAYMKNPLFRKGEPPARIRLPLWAAPMLAVGGTARRPFAFLLAERHPPVRFDSRRVDLRGVDYWP